MVIPWTFNLPTTFLGFGTAPSLTSSEEFLARSSSSGCNKMFFNLFQEDKTYNKWYKAWEIKRNLKMTQTCKKKQ